MAVTRRTSEGVSRRSLLTGGLAGGFLLAFHLPARAVNEPVQPADDTNGKFAPNAFIRIDRSGKTTLVMPQVEMGQGIYTAVAMILAEELDADLTQVTLEHAPRERQAVQRIPLSASRRPEAPLRSAHFGNRCAKPAPARAPCWSRPPHRNGRSIRQAARPRMARSSHSASGRKLSYGALATAAGSQTPPKTSRSRTRRISC